MIKVLKKEEKDAGWDFVVEVDDLKFQVELEKEYWKVLTRGEEEPESLVRRSFEFLLSKEPKESILKSFNLKLINHYFPEFENEIKIG